MITTTPFHPRLSELNTQGLYTHWQGQLSALRYTHAPKHEYFAVRNAVGVFDTSPLYKYRITGPDAERLLSGALVRDIRTCRPGQAQYTAWCDDRGFVMHDGVVVPPLRRRLPAHRRPAHALVVPGAGVRLRVAARGRVRRLRDARRPGAALAGRARRPDARGRVAWPTSSTRRPRWPTRRSPCRAPATPATSGSRSRSRPTARSPCSTRCSRPGHGHSIRPFGEEALMTLRIEAGLPLVDIEWHDARLAISDADCVTPKELGFGWMLRGVRDGSRRFVGVGGDPPRAPRRHVALGDRPASSSTARDWDRLHRDVGLFPPKSEHPLALRVDAARRRPGARSATARASCTPPCCSGTSASPGSAPTSRRPAPTCGSSSRSPTTTRRSGSPRPRCRSSTLPGKG